MKDKVLKLCRRLKKCTLNDLISYTEENEDIIKTALLYLDNEGLIQEKNGNIYYLDKKYKKDHVQAKNINIMMEYRTPEEVEIIIKGFCLEIPPQKLCELIGVNPNCICKYYGVFRKMIYDRQYKLLLKSFFDKPQIGRYRRFYEKYAFFYVYKDQVFVCDKLLRASIEKNFTKSQIREFKNMYCYLARIESHNSNENYMFYRLAEYIWRRYREYAYLYQDLKQNLLNKS
jgi:hypothetical protein